MGESAESKLDAGLFMALRAWENDPEGHSDEDGISISLRFEGSLAAIQAAGFESHSVSGDEARGVVRFKDMRAIAALPAVLWMAAGQRRRVELEVAPKDIRARTGSGGVGTDGLWEATTATGPLSSVANGTGAGVIVAVLDTGIDITHPMFMSQLTPTKVTRILRIWDQGLTPASLAECPPASLLQSGGRTYGVEFKPPAINAALNGGPAIAHKDCEGHGTHVAGIAAGGIRTGAVTGGDLTKVGVAPEADLIVVKLLDVPEHIYFRLSGGMSTTEVGNGDRFRDAVLYSLRTARAEGKPVVINLSSGNNHEPGDGLDDDARWVDQVMDPSHAADNDHFPQGAIIVKSAGNDGDRSRRTVARIVVPPAGTVTVPIKLEDVRGTVQEKFKQCAPRLHHPTMFASFWYRRDFDNVKFAVKLPHRNNFNADMGVGGNFDHGLIVRPGTPPTLAFVPITPRVHEVFFTHGGDPAAPHPAGGTVRRHHVVLGVVPKVSAGTVSYLEGVYEVRITAPPGTELFFMGDHEAWAPMKGVKFFFGTHLADGTPIDAAIDAFVTSEFSATDTLGRHAITVAAYDDKNTAASADHPIADFSSRGPLRDFSSPPGSLPPILTKPDLAAPGVAINSAQGLDTNVGVGIRVPPWTDGVRFIPHDGTSMAAPMTTGVVALMLHKNHALNTTDVRTHLLAGAATRPGTNPAAPGTAHDRAYGAGMVAALESHTATP